MATYIYYFLLAVYGVILAISAVYYLTNRAPGGDASVDWAMGAFYALGLLIITGVALLFWKKPTIGVIILLLPLVWLAIPRIRNLFRDTYAAMPSVKPVEPLNLLIQNTTPAMLHVKLDCWFSTSNKGTLRLYTTLNYNIKPLESPSFLLSDYDTGLLARKSKRVSIMIYEQVNSEHDGTSFVQEIQPCMQFYDEDFTAFENGHYTITVDGSKNTDNFKEEIEMRKKYNGYGSGVF